MSDSFEKLATEHAAHAMEKLGAFNNYLPQGAPWSFNLQDGTFTMGDKTIRMQALGTFSDEHAAWVWAWGNDSMRQHPHLLAGSLRLREYGEQHGVREFGQRGVNLAAFAPNSRLGAERLALIATAVLGAKGYAGVLTSGGFHFYLVSDDPAIPATGPRSPEAVGTYLRTSAEWFPSADPMDLAASYADAVGGRYLQVPGGLVVNLGDTSVTLHYRDGRLDHVGPPIAMI